MNLDIRTPIGLMFLAIGALLALYGLLTINSSEFYARSLGTNINLWWGIFMLVFGAVMLFAARSSSSISSSATSRNSSAANSRSVNRSPEEILIEEREQQLGLEREE